MATNYILTVNFTEQRIDVLRRAGQQVALVRDVTPSRPGDIAWLTFFPRTVSTVTWTEEDYYLFFHQPQSRELQPGQTIYINGRSEPVTPGSIYSLREGVFTRVPGDAGPGNVTISNDMGAEFGDNLYLGLAQGGTVFSDQEITAITPLNLVYVPWNQHATFRITKRVRVFTGDVPTSMILGNNVTSGVLGLDFSGGYEHAIRYETSLNQFVQQS
jgi:hypothetical protein